MAQYLSIALPIPMRRLFTYLLPDGMNAERGMRVLVPFGKRSLTGIVVDPNAAALPDAKAIHEVLDDIPLMNTTMLEFTRWMSEYYLASWGETLHAAVPQGMSPESVITIKLLHVLDEQQLAIIARKGPKRAALLRLLQKHKGPVSVAHLQQQLRSDSISSQLEALEHAGLIEIQRTIKAQAQAKTQRVVQLSEELFSNASMLQQLLDTLDRKAPRQAEVLGSVYLAQRQSKRAVPVHEVLVKTQTTASVIKSLVTKSYLIESTEEVHRSFDRTDEDERLHDRDESTVELTDEQSHASSVIEQALDSAKAKTFLLHGVTGSGKTIVYMHAIRHARTLGKSALILVPEISLTPQLIDRFRSVFGTDIAVLHSRMSIGERFDEWRAIQRGDARIVLGVRSALFAPVQNLGLIIVDEEHEASYKQDSPAPRYNARDSAVMRGIMEGAIVVLGSATPSIESMYNARSAKYHLLSLSKRADNAQLPDIKIVDLVDARKRKQVVQSFSLEMIDAIVDRLAKKEGVILLQNRRGFAPRLECMDCGHVPTCRDCSVSLTYHKHLNQLRCHYCGYTETAVKSCQECGSAEMLEFGAGTQRIEEELNEILEKRGIKARIQRVDLDSTSRKGSLRKILASFRKEEIDILVGTKMLAKGLDFERVTFVGVVNADLQLYMSDFRASERNFQLLTQVAGRAGRSSTKRGEVLIQTMQPKHPAIVATKLAQYELFYSDELQQRLDAFYPPFSRFVVIELSGRDAQLVQQHAQHIVFALPRSSPSLRVLGPTKPDVDRIRGSYRRVIVLKSSKADDPGGQYMRQSLSAALQHYRDRHASSLIRVSVDVDSYSAL